MTAPGTGGRRESLEHTKGGNENEVLRKSWAPKNFTNSEPPPRPARKLTASVLRLERVKLK